MEIKIAPAGKGDNQKMRVQLKGCANVLREGMPVFCVSVVFLVAGFFRAA